MTLSTKAWMTGYQLAKSVIADLSQIETGGVAGEGPVHFCRGATTTNVTLTAVSTSMDGLTLVAGDRILVKNQNTGAQNGIYVVGTVVAGPVAPFTRADDFSTSAEAQTGSLVVVSEGSAAADKIYQLTTNAPITLGTTALTFTAFAPAVGSATPANVADTTAVVGVASTASPSDHAHAHGDLTTGTLHAAATASVNGFQVAADFVKQRKTQAGAAPRVARGACFANMSISAFVGVAGGTAQDGVTYTAGQIVLLTNQTTAAENGLYSVGTVGAGVAALTRVADLTTGDAYVNGCTVEVSEGTLWAGSTWKAMCTGAKVVGTDDPLFYPRCIHAVVTLTLGAYTFGVGDGLFLFSTTKSQVTATRNTANTATLTTGGYAAPAANRTAGKSGTGAVLVRAEVAAGTLNNADISTVDVCITNW